MATISAGASRTFTASANGATFTVSINGGSIAVISGGASDQIGPIATRKTYGPFAIGQTLTVASQSGDVLVDFGDATPQDSLAVNLYDPATGRWLGVIDKAGNEQFVSPTIMGGRRYTQRLMNAPALATFDTTSFRWIESVPFTGKKFVRVKYENDTTSAWAGTMTTAVAGGRAFADNNPLDSTGASPTWSVTSGLAVPAGDASLATNGKWGAAWTPWLLVDFPPATDGGYGSYLYVGMKLSTGTGRGLVRNGSQKFEEWETILSAGSARQKSRRLYQTGADYVTSNQNGMNAPTTGSGGAFYSPAVQFEIMGVDGAITVLNVGDSTRGGQGTTAFNWNWMNQWADSRVSSGLPVSCVNLGFAGKSGAYYMGYLSQLLTDGSTLPTWLVLQPFTANSASESAIQADIQAAISLAEQFEAKGTIVTFSTVGPAVNWFGASSANDAVRRYGNTMIRNLARPYIDLDAVVTDGVSPIAAIKAAYTPDGNHYNDAGNAAIASQAVAPISKLVLGI